MKNNKSLRDLTCCFSYFFDFEMHACQVNWRSEHFCNLSFCIEIYSFPFLFRIKEWWCSPFLKSPIKPKWCAQYIMRTKWSFQNHWQLCISVKLSFITQSSLEQKPSHKTALQKYILEALLKSFQKNLVRNAVLKLRNYDLVDKYFLDKYQKLQLLLYVWTVINPDFHV